LPRLADLGDAAAGRTGLSIRRRQDGAADSGLPAVVDGARQLRRRHPLRGRHGASETRHRRARAPRMSPSAIAASAVAVLFALLLLRVPVWVALVLVGFFGNVALSGWQSAFALAGTAPFDVASSYTLSVVPLFILM